MPVPLTKIPAPNTGTPATKKMQLDYLARIGSIMHPPVVSRPDIAAAASIFASFSANPTTEHMALAERCIVYLSDHKYLALTFDGHIRDPSKSDLIFR